MFLLYYITNIPNKPYLDKNGNRKEYKKFCGKTKKDCFEKRDQFIADHGIKAREMFFGELVEDFIINPGFPNHHTMDSGIMK